MNDKTKRLIVLRQDLYAMVYNYNYEGWKYRIPIEGREAVEKDCNDAAIKMVTEFEMLVKEHYENLSNEQLDK